MASYKIWVATPTFLYLPVYALDRLGILTQVAETLTNSKVDIEIRPSPDGGDSNCIRTMLDKAANEPPNGAIHIAIADPYATRDLDQPGTSVRLLGAFLKAPPFWVIGRKDGTTRAGRKLLCYEPDFHTANLLARDLEGKHGQATPLYKPGAVIDQLFDDAEERSNPGHLRVLTSDLIGMELACQEPDIEIIDRFSPDQYGTFVTTGVLTHAKTLKNHAKDVAVFMEALRAACLLLRTAKISTATLVERLSQEKDFQSELRIRSDRPPPGGLSEEQAKLVADRIFREGLYADSLLISPADWNGGLRARQIADKDRPAARKYFHRIYRSGPATFFIENWIEKAMKDYVRFARDARNHAISLLMITGILMVIYGSFLSVGRFIIKPLSNVDQILLEVANLLAVISLAAGLYVGMSPSIGRIIVHLRLERIFRLDLYEEKGDGIVGPILAIIFMMLSFLFTKQLFEDNGYAQNLIMGVAAVLGILTWHLIRLWRTSRD